MSHQFLLIDVADRVATVTINRPDKLNALNDVLITELGAAFDDLANHAEVGAVVLTGAGRAFAAGADIAGLAANSADEMHRLSRAGQLVYRKIERMPKPVIAAVNGFAFGGGCELALACHLRIASQLARFGLPEVKLGLIPGYGGTQRLPRLIGRGRALQLLLTGEPVDGAEAYRIGLANAVVDHAALGETSRSMALTMLKNGPLALAAAIESVDGGLDRGLDDALMLESKLFAQLGHTADMREGTRAFLEKRPAAFRGA